MFTKIGEFQDSKVAEEYLNFLSEYDGEDNFLLGLLNVAVAQGNLTSLAQKAGLEHDYLHKTLAPYAKPQWETIKKVLNAMGFELYLKTTRKKAFPQVIKKAEPKSIIIERGSK